MAKKTDKKVEKKAPAKASAKATTKKVSAKAEKKPSKTTVKKAETKKATPAKKSVKKVEKKVEKKAPAKVSAKATTKKVSAKAEKKPSKTTVKKAETKKVTPAKKSEKKVEKKEKAVAEKVKIEPKKRGRKKKVEDPADLGKKAEEPVKKKRGRKKKVEGPTALDGTPLAAAPPGIKRRPGRPPKNRPVVASSPDFTLPKAGVLIPQRVKPKPKKKLSSSLPGTNLAALISPEKVESIKGLKASPNSASDKVAKINKETNIPSKPSWTPRDWVTDKGERLVIKSSELLTEKKASEYDDSSYGGVISPEEVDEVIRKIRKTFEKKPKPKPKATNK
ncbi:MAG TPA: hypothetical protein V6C96_03980 [Vampirovibrionales bacterium]